jgi:hypothetical protein
MPLIDVGGDQLRPLAGLGGFDLVNEVACGVISKFSEIPSHSSKQRWKLNRATSRLSIDGFFDQSSATRPLCLTLSGKPEARHLLCV